MICTRSVRVLFDAQMAEDDVRLVHVRFLINIARNGSFVIGRWRRGKFRPGSHRQNRTRPFSYFLRIKIAGEAKQNAVGYNISCATKGIVTRDRATVATRRYVQGRVGSINQAPDFASSNTADAVVPARILNFCTLSRVQLIWRKLDVRSTSSEHLDTSTKSCFKQFSSPSRNHRQGRFFNVTRRGRPENRRSDRRFGARAASALDVPIKTASPAFSAGS